MNRDVIFNTKHILIHITQSEVEHLPVVTESLQELFHNATIATTLDMSTLTASRNIDLVYIHNIHLFTSTDVPDIGRVKYILFETPDIPFVFVKHTKLAFDLNYTLLSNAYFELRNYEKKVYSQNGEDGVVLEILDRVGLLDGETPRFYVEFGVESGKECNTRILSTMHGKTWSGLLMDGGNENPHISLHKEFITQENILSLFKKYDVPEHIDLLSVDIDYNDFYVLARILEKYTCGVVVVEYNATHPPPEDKIAEYNPQHNWDFTDYFGASLQALYNLLVKHNTYSLVYTESHGVNAFFVHNALINTSLFKNINNISALYSPPNYIPDREYYKHPVDPHNRKYVSSTDLL